MNLNKFTEKSVQAIQDAQNIAQEYGNPELTQQHILLALVRAKGLITQLIIKLGCSEQKVESDCDAADYKTAQDERRGNIHMHVTPWSGA